MTFEFNKSPQRWNKELEDLVSKPKIVGYFSVDGDRNYLPDSSRLMYYKPPMMKNVNFDLNKGIETAIRKPSDEDGRISHLLEWIKLNHALIQTPGSKSWIEPNFVCSCRVLAMLMCTQFSRNVGWIVCAAKWKGSIYMCRFQTSDEIQILANVPQKFSSWGFKFEQHMLSVAPDKDPDTSKPVVEPAEFRCIFERCFGNHTVLFTAEMDGLYSKTAVKDPLPLEYLRFVELKTLRKIETKRQDQNFRKYKLLRWWTQSFLVGNEKVLCGFRDDNGIVHNLKSYSLPEMVEMSKEFWNPVSCIKKCQEILDHIAKTVLDDCDKTIYKFEKKPYDDVIVTEELSPQSEYAFIPLSYFAATG